MSRANAARLAVLALLWGSSFLWIKLALRGFTPVQLTFARLVLGCAMLTVIALSRRMRFPTEASTWIHLFMAALVGNALPYVLFGLGEQTVGSNVAGVLNSTTPLWTVVVAYLASTDRSVTGRRAVGIALGFLGTVLIFTPWEAATEIASWGGLACLCASASYGLSYVYMGRFLTGRGIPPVVLSASQLAAATALLTLAAPFGGLDAPTWRVDAMMSVVILGVFGTGVAYVLSYRLLVEEGAAAASTVAYLMPIVAVVLGYVILREPMTIAMVGGGSLVLCGVALAQRWAAPLRTERNETVDLVT